MADEAVDSTWWPTEGRATHALIDLDAIDANMAAVSTHIPDAAIIAVVKANAYGHGAVMVGHRALAAGASMLAVACVDEALELRDGGIDRPILVLGPAESSEYAAALRADTILSLATPDQVEEVGIAAVRVGIANATVHLKLDTGMNRYGAAPADALSMARAIVGSDRIRLGGVFTHFADADGDDLAFTEQQTGRLVDAVRQLTEAGIDPGLVHSSNTAGTFRLGRGVNHAIRLGIGLYGLNPDPSVPLLPGMRPALSLRTRVAQVRRLQVGDTVSYSRTWRAEGSESIALLPLGYADGLRRALSNRGWVGIGGQRSPIRGRVCMDQVVVGQTGPGVRPGTGVTVIGDPATGGMTMDAAAELAGTIAYEIATGITARVPRWFLSAGLPCAVQKGASLRHLT